MRKIEVVEFLDGRHPEVGVVLQLIVQPLGAAFLSPDAQEVGPGLPPMFYSLSRRFHSSPV